MKYWKRDREMSTSSYATHGKMGGKSICHGAKVCEIFLTRHRDPRATHSREKTSRADWGGDDNEAELWVRKWRRVGVSVNRSNTQLLPTISVGRLPKS